ncbi:hypothetical protein TNCV_2691051 [Trichonephila clavipes]|uniref:Uncharacterized protein n=1 Tax=Trichonephila clavipes TaxID=2585209 RepID=A0A8X6VYS8_TRICX|nr:hypothetical protein TNCV_2691051 [Trichonephila clavipes]
MSRVRSSNTYQHVSDFDKGQIVVYRNCVVYRITVLLLASVTNAMTVSRIWNRWVQDGNTELREGSQLPLSLAAKKTGMLSAWFCLQHQDDHIRARWHRGELSYVACNCDRHTSPSSGIMVCYFVDPTPLAHVDASRDVLPRGVGMLRPYPGGYTQCQSDRLIDRPSIWCTRYGDGVDLSLTGLWSQRANGAGMKMRSAVGRSATFPN